MCIATRSKMWYTSIKASIFFDKDHRSSRSRKQVKINVKPQIWNAWDPCGLTWSMFDSQHLHPVSLAKSTAGVTVNCTASATSALLRRAPCSVFSQPSPFENSTSEHLFYMCKTKHTNEGRKMAIGLISCGANLVFSYSTDWKDIFAIQSVLLWLHRSCLLAQQQA